MISEFLNKPFKVVDTKHRRINIFNIEGKNIDRKVVDDFGEEWKKFQDHNDEIVRVGGLEYFDIVTDEMVNSNTYLLDVGCGTGRWTKYLSSKAGFIEAVDPSDAIFTADALLGSIDNVRLSKASVETLPFADETFDFVMSIGVLHHIPNTQKALTDCVRKVKRGGYFYVYLYHNMDKRGFFYKALFKVSNGMRQIISRLPKPAKHIVCDGLAVTIYLPIVFLGRIFRALGFEKIAKKMPLSAYQNYSFFIIRNDTLDRFGTRLEQRFSAAEIVEMMENAGLTNIVVSTNIPFYHAVGRRV